MAIHPSDLPFILAEVGRVPFTGTAFAVGEEPAGLAPVIKGLGFDRVELAADLEADIRAPASDTAPQFDAVFDLGASMRTFHVRRALTALGRRVAVGGRVVHAVPSANHIDQGFYMASPRLFHDYYCANGWRLETLMLTCPAQDGAVVEGIAYTPGSLRDVAHGGLDDRRYRVFCVATRLAVSTVGLVPQHGMYVDAWKRGAVSSGDQPPVPNPVAAWMRRTRWVYRIVNGLTGPRKKTQIRAACLTPAVRYPLRTERG